MIAGTAGIGEVSVNAQTVLRVTVPMPGGPSSRLLLQARLDPQTGTLTSSLIDPTAGPTRVLATRLQRERGLLKRLRFPGGRGATLELLEGSKRVPPFVKPPGKRKGAALIPLFENVSVEVKPAGGALIMSRGEAKGEEVDQPECGDVDRVRASRGRVGPPVVRLEPGKDLQANPVMREFFQVPIDSADLIPRTELRISGGPFDENDPHRRFSIGDRRDSGWSPGVMMDGRCRLVLGRPMDPAQPPPVVLKVTGTVYLPPVGRNDPLVVDLMAQAFMAGLLQMGQPSTAVTLAFKGLPATIVNTEGFDYTLTLTRQGGQLVKIKRCLETVTAIEGGTDVVLKTVDGVPAELTDSSAHDVHVPHPAFTIAATKVRIKIQLLIGIGTTTRVVELESTPIRVDPAPIT
jgi:hypothetical protein